VKVREIMTTEVVTLSPDIDISDAVRIFAEKGIGGAPIVDDEGNVVGMVTDSDIFKNLRLKYKQYNIRFPVNVSSDMPSVDFKTQVVTQDLAKAFESVSKTKVHDIMRKKVITVSPDDLVEEVVPLIVDKKINRLPVVEGGKLVGLISRGDIIRSLLAE
jgi:CBS domain-containing protein